MDDKKLIESLRTCGGEDGCNENCVEYSACSALVAECSGRLMVKAAERLEQLLPPCKIGDTAWAIRSFHGKDRAQEGIVSEIYYIRGTRPGADMRLCVTVKHVARGEYGKTIFATREEAEAALLRKQEERRRGVWLG